jgi:hypothetical protein
MNQFDNEYCFLVRPRDDNKDVDALPFLRPDKTMAKLPYRYAEAQPMHCRTLK